MINEAETWQRIAIGGFPIIVSLFLFFMGERKQFALALLVIGALTLRLAFISLDPFLHPWDERFHALVAKNLMTNPWVPMLRTDPILSYDYKAWCCNHIWVHKQPLFMWQMALSMKAFGVNEIALRLPSAILGAISVFFVYQITEAWTSDRRIAYVSALLFALSHYQLEMTAGRYNTDHNDVVFVFYVTASIWAFTRYIRKKHLLWAVVIGVFVGAAILNKWLTGLLVFSGWGLYILLDKSERKNRKNYIHLIISLMVAVIIFLPWQLYIHSAFPLESTWEREFNFLHLFEAVENHGGSYFYHFKIFGFLYNEVVAVLAVIGLLVSLRKYKSNLFYSLLFMILVIYAFFTLVATKMPAFTFPVSAMIYGFAAVGLVFPLQLLIEKLQSEKARNWASIAGIMLVAFFALNPIDSAGSRSVSNKKRNNQMERTRQFRSLPDEIVNDYLILNCNAFEDVELMFYRDCNAYVWFPDETKFNSLINTGFKIAVFASPTGPQVPGYVGSAEGVKFIK